MPPTGQQRDGGTTNRDAASTEKPITPPIFSVTRHTFVDDDRDQVLRDLDHVVDLGARMVRADFWWFSVEPEMDKFDERALDHFDWFVKAAASKGIGVIGVLSNPPDWAKNMYLQGGSQPYAERFKRYVAAVAERVRDRVTYYQLSNEINHPAIDIIQDDLPVLHAAKEALVEHDPNHVTIINVLVDGHNAGVCPSWSCDLEGILKSHVAADIDVIGIDYYPDTWSVLQDWNGDVLFRLFSLGKQYGKRVAIMETGFSSRRCLPLSVNLEANQAIYVTNTLEAVANKLLDQHTTQGVPMLFLNWYELEDRDSQQANCLANFGVEVIESHFGLLREDRSPKPAYDRLRMEIPKFNQKFSPTRTPAQ